MTRCRLASTREPSERATPAAATDRSAIPLPVMESSRPIRAPTTQESWCRVSDAANVSRRQASHRTARRRLPGRVQSPYPAPARHASVDNAVHEVQPSHPAPPTGCSQHRDGVQPAQPRGAAAALEPSSEPSTELPTGPADACPRSGDRPPQRRRGGRLPTSSGPGSPQLSRARWNADGHRVNWQH